jgi:hypothetical protein
MLQCSARTLFFAAMLQFSTFAASAETIREERTVTVNGHQETWRIVWATPTVPACPAEELEMSVTCPCTGFAYGEAGTLNLVRLHSGREIDRLNLEAAFALGDNWLPMNATGRAILQRKPLIANDLNQTTDPRSGRPTDAFITAVKSRPIAQIMSFKDFDHDGQATEFLLQVGAGPCGHTAWVAVGLSQDKPRLHLLTSKERPRQPLVISHDAWDALLKTSAPPPIEDFGCGDHGLDQETKVMLHAAAGKISAQRLTYACESSHNETSGKLLSQAPW